MPRPARRARTLACLGIALVAIGGCGGGGSDNAEVGDCIDADNQVVDCSSADATQKLVSDQSAPDAIACVQIGEKPQVEVKVGDGTFCAEPK
jgi:hypothetical protein